MDIVKDKENLKEVKETFVKAEEACADMLNPFKRIARNIKATLQSK